MTLRTLLVRLKAIERIPSWGYWWLPPDRRPTFDERMRVAVKLLREEVADRGVK